MGSFSVLENAVCVQPHVLAARIVVDVFMASGDGFGVDSREEIGFAFCSYTSQWRSVVRELSMLRLGRRHKNVLLLPGSAP